MSVTATEAHLKAATNRLRLHPLDYGAWLEVAAALVVLGTEEDKELAFATIGEGARIGGQVALAIACGRHLAETGSVRGPELVEAVIEMYAEQKKKRAGTSPVVRGEAPSASSSAGAPMVPEGTGTPLEEARTLVQKLGTWLTGRKIDKVPAAPLLSALTKAGARALVGVMSPRPAPAGTVIIDVGEPATALYWLAHGTVTVSRETGAELGELHSGAFFGEIALVSASKRTARVTARDDIWVLEIPARAIEKAAQKHPQLAEVLAGHARQRLLANLVRTSELFRALDEDDRDGLLAKLSTELVAAGTTFITEGKPNEHLWVVVSGRCEVKSGGAALAELGPGAAVGEISLVSGAPAVADVTALEPAVLLRLSKHDFDVVAKKHPALLAEVEKLVVARETANRALFQDASDLIRMKALVLLAVLTACVDTGPGTPPRVDAKYARAHLLAAPPGDIDKFDIPVGDKAIYLGNKIDRPRLAPGATLIIKHYWKVLKPIGKDWRAFALVRGPQGTADFMNLEASDMQVAYPVEKWKAGDIIEDEQAITIRPDWTSPYGFVYVGLIQVGRHTTLDRMAVTGPRTQDRAIVAAKLEIDLSRAPPPLGTIHIPRAAGPITIDGMQMDQAWNTAVTSPEFVTADGSPDPSGKATAKLVWDDQYLYVFMSIMDTDIGSPYKTKDDSLWKADAIEMFVDADGNRAGYIELQVNPHNTQFDSWFAGARGSTGDVPWDSQMVSAVKVRGTPEAGDTDIGWDVELGIPWAAVRGRDDKMPVQLPPRIGDRWKLNIVRVDFKSGNDRPSASSWNKIGYGDWHGLEKMLTAVFADPTGSPVASPENPAPPIAPPAAGSGSAIPPPIEPPGPGSGLPPAPMSGSASAPISPTAPISPRAGSGTGSGTGSGGAAQRAGSAAPAPPAPTTPKPPTPGSATRAPISPAPPAPPAPSTGSTRAPISPAPPAPPAPSTGSGGGKGGGSGGGSGRGPSGKGSN